LKDKLLLTAVLLLEMVRLPFPVMFAPNDWLAETLALMVIEPPDEMDKLCPDVPTAYEPVTGGEPRTSW
jgi:hypothetical protein